MLHMMLTGSTAQEVDDALHPADLARWNTSTLMQYVRRKLDGGPFIANGTAALILPLYGQDNLHQSPEYQLTTMVSDLRAICPLNELLKVMTLTFDSPVYRYVVNRLPPQKIESDNGGMYAFHGADLYAFFDTLSDYAESMSEQDVQFQDRLQKHVLEFVGTGQLAAWSAYPNSIALLSEDLDFIPEYNPGACELWKTKGFLPEYAWMN